MNKKLVDKLSYDVLGAAIEVHKTIGPGMIESVYHDCMKHELSLRNIGFQTELVVPIDFKGMKLAADLKCDLFVEDLLVIELKAVSTLAPIHQAQLFTYMKLLNAPKGLLVNFNCVNLFRDGQKTLVNDIYRDLPEH
jgi:GxxExxY protein